MSRYRIFISYDGTDFCGWQKQKEHRHASDLPSIQGEIETALSKVFNESVSLSASGRTDAGVHAVQQVGHFDTDRPVPKDLCWALRAHLPSSIVIKKAFLAPDDFHATLSATHKTYRYRIWNQHRPSAILNRYTWWVRRPLDIDYLNNCSKFLIKNQDFKSFQSVGTDVQTTIREVFSAKWQRQASGIVEFSITGNGFLKQMVRNIVGTQVQMYQFSQPIEIMDEILLSRDRRKAGPAAPPQGLFLWRVYYPQLLDNRCRQI